MQFYLPQMMTTQQQEQASSGSNGSDRYSNINLMELKETVDRIASYNGVEIVQILNTSGDILAECVNNNNNSNSIRSPVATPTSKNTVSGNDFMNDNMTAVTAATGIHSDALLSASSPNVMSTSTASTAHSLLRTAQQYIQNFQQDRDNNDDEITFLQIRSKHGYELMIAPHFGYALVVVKMIA
jgi:hypothetical protein